MNPTVAWTVLVACCVVAWGTMTYLEGIVAGPMSSSSLRPLPRRVWHNKTTTTTTMTISSSHPSTKNESVGLHSASTNTSSSTYYEPPDFGVPPSFALRGRGTSNNESDFRHTLRLLPLPVRVVEQYIQWHSVDALRRDPTHRRYLVAFYSCPLQAGNRLHHFLSGFYWSIVTNRTMLWKYWDTETCRKYGSLYNPHICLNAKTVSECDPILNRASWIPSYDEWHSRLHLPPPMQVPYYATHHPHIKDRHIQWGPGNDEQIQGIDELPMYRNTTVLALAQTRFKIGFMARSKDSNLLLRTAWSRNINTQLHRHGIDFWHGMLQHYSWQLTPRIVQDALPIHSYLQYPQSNRSHYYSIALHSRHINPQDDGCDVSREMVCVNALLAPQRRFELRRTVVDTASSNSTTTTTMRHRPCAIHLLSDRPCTLSRLTERLAVETGCEALVALHDSRTDFLSEHGPFAGAGFFQDWALALQAQSAFIGLKRSSSDLIKESLTFQRGRMAWQTAILHGETNIGKLGAAIDNAPLDSCMLSYKNE